MAIKINQNIFSLLVQRNLDRTTTQLEDSYEKLSSGQRINKAADDPARLATSELLRYEVNGLQQATRNVTGAFSMVGTAETQLENMGNLLQRARELLVQGSNDTLQATDRSAIQEELNQIVEEIDRIATTSKFNDQMLLNGELTGKKIQIGTQITDSIILSLGDYRTNVLGAVSTKTSDFNVSVTAPADGEIKINGHEVPAPEPDGVSISASDASVLAKSRAINSIESTTGVHADFEPPTRTGILPVGSINLDGTTNDLIINGVSIAPVTVAAGDSSGALVTAINANSNTTGVTASIDGSGALVLSAEDGRNMTIATTGSAGTGLGLVAAGNLISVETGKLVLSSTNTFTIEDPLGNLGMSAVVTSVQPDTSTALDQLSVGNAETANSFIRTVDAALLQVNAARSQLGAVYNRLESMQESLSQRINDHQNTDSAIRDTDFAYESARLTQMQILQEAGIAMLTQANSTPRRALELLNS